MTLKTDDSRRVEIAKLILADLVPADVVAEATGLQLSVVEGLAKELV